MGAIRRPSFASSFPAGLAFPAWLWLVLVVFSGPAYGIDYPWYYLTPENDSRDDATSENDEIQSRNMVTVINQDEPLFHQHLLWKKIAIKDLLSVRAPFCEMHFDAVRPFWLTPSEKDILREYFKRGGFILFFIDAYPYPQREFWKIKEWPLIDFLRKELPGSDPTFTVGRATDEFSIFHIHYQTTTADSIRHELQGNPNTPNRTLLFYNDRLCSFVMGRYNLLEDNEWIPASRPFDPNFSLELKSYRLIVNIYMSAMAE